MSRALLPLSPNLPADLLAEIEGAHETLAAAKANSTQKAYASDWDRFCTFCEARNVEALPAHPDVVALFAHVEAEAGIAPVTIGRRIAAINHHHKESGFASPIARDGAGVIAQMMAGVRRKYARKKKQKAPAEADVLKTMLATIEGEGLRALRDRAILAVGMAGALRRSELAAMQLSDLQFVEAGLRITIPKSKRDQEGHGQVIAIPDGRFIRPVALLRDWLTAAELDRADPISGRPPIGPVFRRLTRSDALTISAITDKTVARLVKATAAAAGLDETIYSAHSLRAGFLTQAAADRANLFKMKDHSRHKSLETVAEYVRDAAMFDDHAGQDFL
ncbi:site-specific integrase [Sphingobium sp. TKS]|uniref:site-specific integrase n=1 Tax=Sphingobium sp. TKS TaxID=1315974 RepID=UPI000770013B|nr:site-specific integrase [Sphingobium sp. TKS]AMK26127.1 integrase family protein [Sphingobium sp. TKS]